MKSPWCDIRAIASRSEDAARKAADALDIPTAYGSYEALLADPAIEAIYNPLPNHLHVPLTLAAARAGKHVLCEKPIALTAQEAAQLRDAAGHVLIAEAFMVRFHPQWLRARELVREGRIGTLRVVQAFFAYDNLDPANIRDQAEIGGGGLYDIGCYPIVAGRFFFEAEPRRGIALIERDPTFHTDRLTSALVDFGDGIRLDFTVSTQLAPHQRIELSGTTGRIEIPIPFNPGQGAETTLLIDDCSSLEGTGDFTSRRCRRATSTSCKARRSRAPCAARSRCRSASRTRSPQHLRAIDALFPVQEDRDLGGGRRVTSRARQRDNPRMSPAEIVDRQLDAYNARDLERFVELAGFDERVQAFRPPAPEAAIEGRAALASTTRRTASAFPG